MQRIFILLLLLSNGYLSAQCTFDSLTLNRIKKLYVAELSYNVNLMNDYLDCIETNVEIRCYKTKTIGFEGIDFYCLQFIGEVPVHCFDTILKDGSSKIKYKDISNPKNYFIAYDSTNNFVFRIGGFRSSELLCVIDMYGKFRSLNHLNSKARLHSKYKIDKLDLKRGSNLIRCD